MENSPGLESKRRLFKEEKTPQAGIVNMLSENDRKTLRPDSTYGVSLSTPSESARRRRNTRKQQTKVLAVLRARWWDCSWVFCIFVFSVFYTEHEFHVITKKAEVQKRHAGRNGCRQTMKESRG